MAEEVPAFYPAYPEDSQAQPQPIRHVGKSRNRAGCLTCRQRKKRCDTKRDVCSHCTRLNLVCRWETPRDLGRQSPKPSRNSPNSRDGLIPITSSAVSIAPNPMDFLARDASELAQHSLDRKLALRYYIQTFTPMLTTSLENNGFLSVLLPMAIEDRPLLDMLIAWSSSHLSLCNDEYRVKALEHRSTALQSFASSLSANKNTPEVLLAGCLVFCSMSAILGDTAGWHNHLDGAARIIRSAHKATSGSDGLAAISSTYDGRWLLRNFAYHDILMSITLQREPLIPGQYWITESKTAIDSYFGLASEPMALLSMISSLNHDMLKSNEQAAYFSPNTSDSSSPSTHSSTPGSPPLAKDFSTRAYNIEMELRNWSCAYSGDSCLISLAETYRSAALIYLYRVIRCHIPNTTIETTKKIAPQVNSVIQHAGNMPLGCLPECTLLFPLFMAGGEATSKADIKFIRERLHHIATHRHFQNAASALSVLEELWLQHTSFTGLTTGKPLDWTDILRRRDWKLALS